MSLTTQEKKFADEYVMLFFHSPAIYAEMGVDAARKAGYEVPVDCSKADALQKSLMAKAEVTNYIDAEINRLRQILAPGNRRNLWAVITGTEPGNLNADDCFGNIIVH